MSELNEHLHDNESTKSLWISGLVEMKLFFIIIVFVVLLQTRHAEELWRNAIFFLSLLK